jgi:Protein of unknown function, DUF481
MLSTVLFAFALAQTEPSVAAPVPPVTAEELSNLLRRTAAAAEKSAEAAERSARAAEAAAGVPPQAPPSAEAAAPAPGALKFTGATGVSFVAMSGNSNAITGSANLNVNFLFYGWTIGVKGLGAYGRSRAANETVYRDTALNASGEVKGARSITDLVGVYVLGGGGTDHVAKINWRAYGELGGQLTFFRRMEGDLVKLQLVTELGLRYQRESWFQFYDSPDQAAGVFLVNPTPNIVALKAAADFRYAVNKNVVFSERLELLPDVLTPANFNMLSNTSIGVKLIGPLSVTASFLLKYDNLPPPGAQKLDTILALGVDVSF